MKTERQKRAKRKRSEEDRIGMRLKRWKKKLERNKKNTA